MEENKQSFSANKQSFSSNKNPEISQAVGSEVKTDSTVVAPQSSGNWWKIGILMVGLVLAGSIVYAGWQFSQKQTMPSVPTPTPVVQLSPSPTPDLYTEASRSATANWKTYQDPNLKYTFKYPNDWTLQTEKSSDGKIWVYLTYFFDKKDYSFAILHTGIGLAPSDIVQDQNITLDGHAFLRRTVI